MITKHKVVTVHYKLNEENGEGELIEQTYGSNPLKFLFGIGQMIPGFEAQLEGKNPGDKFSFTLQPEDAYGPYDERGVIEVELEHLKDESGNIDPTKIYIGGVISMEDHQGRVFQGEIVEMSDTAAIIDFNHPMAGVVLHFEGDIIEVRDATDSEIDHQHVH